MIGSVSLHLEHTFAMGSLSLPGLGKASAGSKLGGSAGVAHPEKEVFCVWQITTC